MQDVPNGETQDSWSVKAACKVVCQCKREKKHIQCNTGVFLYPVLINVLLLRNKLHRDN